jgi:hypothetical protein
MPINRVILSGIFSFPYGDAPGSRILNLALGFKKNIEDVNILSAYFHDNSQNFSSEGVKTIKGLDISYKCIEPIGEASSKLSVRINERIKFFSTISKLVEKIIDELRGDEQEILFLYGRSYLFLKSLLKKIKERNYKTKLIFDVVEPPRSETSLLEYAFHPFLLDSVFVFTKLLPKFDACSFISYKLKEDFGQKVLKHTIVPSVIYKTTHPEIKYLDNTTIKIGYLGALYNKDYPELMYQLCEALFLKKQPFEFYIIGRFQNFKEGKAWEQKFLNSPFNSHLRFYNDPDEFTKWEVLENLDFITLFRKPELLQAYTFPTRVAELLGLGKVLLINHYGDFTKYFTDYENVLVFDKKTIKEEVIKINQVYNQDDYIRIAKQSLSILDNALNPVVLSNKLLALFN